MITRIQALNYRCLRYIDQSLEPFQVLVGPNASGKSTFLDVVNFLGDLVSEGLDEAIGKRTNNFHDLVWGREGSGFELAIEARVPKELIDQVEEEERRSIVRYEVGLKFSPANEWVQFAHERVLLLSDEPPREPIQLECFPQNEACPPSIYLPKGKGYKVVVKKVMGGNDNYYSETKRNSGGSGWAPSFRLGPRKSALGSLPAEPTKLKISAWLRDLLVNSVQNFVLNSSLIRRASAPGQGRGFRTDGSNLPWVLDGLLINAKPMYDKWMKHLRIALPNLSGVRVVEREDDRHKYLMLRYDNGLEVPSWMASDGTLRLMALTLPAYIPDFRGVYLIEEPENGVHPRAAEALYQSLNSVYNAQILLATHSPVILSQVKPKDVLCFAKTTDGQTDVVRGDQHPALRNWQRESDLGMLLAAGVLG